MITKQTTTQPTTDEQIATRRGVLIKARDERLDQLDYPRTWTQRQVNVYEADTTKIDQEIAAFESAVATYAAIGSIDADTKWLADAIPWRATCSAERLAIKSPIRDRALMERAQSLEWSIRLIDYGLGISKLGPIITLASTRVGELMAAAGYDVVGLELLRGPNGFRGSLLETEARIKTLTRQRAKARTALDAVLMSDDERAALEGESAQLRDAFNAMNVKMGPAGRLVAYDDDGAVLAISKMTPLQRKAFERMDATV